MASVFWNVNTNGAWDDAINWSPQVVPGTGDDAVLGVTGFAVVQPCTVSVTASIDPKSITISDAQAVLSVGDDVTVSVANDVTSTGDIELQKVAHLVVGGDLSNVASPQGNGQVNVDTNSSGGGSMTVTGTLSNAGGINIGSAALTATTTVSAAALENTGLVNLAGNSAVGTTQQAVLDIAASAPTTWTGSLHLSGQGQLRFGSGSITDIAQGAEIDLWTPDGYIADASAATTNSALNGLAENDGVFHLEFGAAVSLAGSLERFQLNPVHIRMRRRNLHIRLA